jgi:hypothetical protein
MSVQTVAMAPMAYSTVVDPSSGWAVAPPVRASIAHHAPMTARSILSLMFMRLSSRAVPPALPAT